MKKYKLIKTYPNSQKLGFVFNELDYPNSEFNKDIKYSILNYPEFWEEV